MVWLLTQMEVVTCKLRPEGPGLGGQVNREGEMVLFQNTFLHGSSEVATGE